MATLLALRNRKKAIDTIYRASCAMKAAALARVFKVENTLQIFKASHNLVTQHENAVHEWLYSTFAMNENGARANILIGADKGMCGDFLNHITSYYKQYHNNEHWIFFGNKLD